MRGGPLVRRIIPVVLLVMAIPALVALAAPGPGQYRVRAPLITRDGFVPTATPKPRRTPWPALLPCGDMLVPIDKQHELAADCEPVDLVALPLPLAYGSQRLRLEAANAFIELADAAEGDGYRLSNDSAYRSYAVQAEVFATWVGLLGLDEAERTSARAGHSEHQLGTTVDVCGPSGCLDAFAGSPEAAWVAGHAWEHGFLVSYPDEKEAVTGYAPEPWHIRYVGREVAAKVRASGITLHEYLLP